MARIKNPVVVTTTGRIQMLATTVMLLSGCATTMQVTGMQFTEGDPLKVCMDDPAACGSAFERYANPSHLTGDQSPLDCSVEGPQEEGTDKRTIPHSCAKDSWEQPKGTYVVETKVLCGPKTEETIALNAPWSGSFRVELPKPRKAFLGSNTKVALFPASVKAGLWRAESWKSAAPAFTEVEVLRDWPLWEGERNRVDCTYSVGRIIDAGGALQPGTLVVVKVDQLTATRPEGASASASLAKTREAAEHEERATEAAAAELPKISAAETKSGRCTPERHAKMEQVLNAVMPLFTGSDYTLAEHWIVAGGPRSRLDLRTGLGGKYEFLAFGFGPVGLEVKGPDGYPLTTESPYAMTLGQNGWDGSIESRAANANPLSKYSVNLKGSGCSLVMVLYNHAPM